MKKLKFVGVVTGAAISGAFVNFKYKDSKKQALQVANVPAPEQMVNGVNFFGVTRAILGMLPDSTRRSLMLAGSGGKSHELRDTWDLNKQSPYKVDQVRCCLFR